MDQPHGGFVSDWLRNRAPDHTEVNADRAALAQSIALEKAARPEEISRSEHPSTSFVSIVSIRSRHDGPGKREKVYQN
jgi:hypothetical protein